MPMYPDRREDPRGVTKSRATRGSSVGFQIRMDEYKLMWIQLLSQWHLSINGR